MILVLANFSKILHCVRLPRIFFEQIGDAFQHKKEACDDEGATWLSGFVPVLNCSINGIVLHLKKEDRDYFCFVDGRWESGGAARIVVRSASSFLAQRHYSVDHNAHDRRGIKKYCAATKATSTTQFVPLEWLAAHPSHSKKNLL